MTGSLRAKYAQPTTSARLGYIAELERTRKTKDSDVLPVVLQALHVISKRPT
jgi:hypothetical protein